MPKFHFSSPIAAAPLALAITIAVSGPAQEAGAQERAYEVESVAVTGEPAPGTAGLSFGCFDPIIIDLGGSGVVAFIASTAVCDPATGMLPPDGDQAIWAGTPAALDIVARAGDPAPGGTAQTLTVLHGALVNGAGDVMYSSELDTSSFFFPDSGIWVRSAGVSSLLARSSDPAPGTTGLTFSNLGFVDFDDLGVTTFFGEAGGYGGVTGIWRGTPGNLSPMVMSGDLAPGTAGLHFDFINAIAVTDDFAAFTAYTTDPDPARAEGIWVAGPGGVDAVARIGDVAPGTGGRVFRAFFSYGLVPPQPAYQEGDLDGSLVDIFVPNALGDVAFTAYIDPFDPADTYSDAGIWIRDTAGLGLVAVTGAVAPGTASEPFLYFNHLNFNAAGQVAFDASLEIADTTRDHGIWTGLPGNLRLVVREGDPAPGTSGETFGSLVLGPSMNEAGELAFFAQLRESGGVGIWAAAADGTLSLIARTGESLQLGIGDYRTIASILPVHGGIGNANWFSHHNQAGQSAFFAIFADGNEAILVASPVTSSPNLVPVADAGPDQMVAENNAFTVDGSGSTDPDGTILSFAWSIDGVAVASGPTATIGPLPVGSHTVTLTVTDRSGASASDQMTVTVFPNLPPVANAGPDQTVPYNQLVTFDGTGTTDPEGDALTYVWSVDYCYSNATAFSDSSTTTSGDPAPGEFPNCPDFATGPTPTDGPFKMGVQTITLTVTDIHGASATDQMILTVSNDPPVANAGPDRTILTLESVTIDGSASADPENDIVGYSWSIGGVLVGSGPMPIVGPFDAGIYTISLTVHDGGGGEATDEMILTVMNRPPVANAGPDRTANHVQTVTIDGTASADPEGGVLSYSWSLGGVQIATVANPTVGPLDVGMHIFTLTVTDDKGESASDNMILTVTNGPPAANAGSDQTANHAQAVVLDGSGSTDPEGGPLSFVWRKGGVQIATGANATVGPFPVGAHTVTLTVTDNHGATATDSMIVSVVNEAPTANAGPDQTANYAQAVTLDGTSSRDPEGGSLAYAWAKNGVQIGTGATPMVGPFPVGTHTVTLTVTDDHGAMATDGMTITVINEFPVADAGPDRTVNFTKGKSTPVILDGSASTDPEGGALSYAWSEGGQNVGTGAILELVLREGVYTFTLSVTDELGLSTTGSVVVTVTKGGNS